MSEIKPKDSMVRLFIFRSSDMGSIWWPSIFLDDEKIADLPTYTYTYKYLLPGKYVVRGVQVMRNNGTLCSSGRSCDRSIAIEVDGNRDIYIEYGPQNCISRTLPTGVGGFYQEQSCDFGFREVSDYGACRKEVQVLRSAPSLGGKKIIKECSLVVGQRTD